MDKSWVLLAQMVLHSNKSITIPELQMVLKVRVKGTNSVTYFCTTVTDLWTMITTTPRAMVVALSLAPPIIGTHRGMTSLLRNTQMSGTHNTL
jgi:hypothetical protein